MRQERETPKPWKKTGVIGKPMPRVDAYERVSGSATYPSDTSLPDMLYGAILRCPHAHAKILDIDTREAEKLPGVRAVVKGDTHGVDVEWSYARGFKTKLFEIGNGRPIRASTGSESAIEIQLDLCRASSPRSRCASASRSAPDD